MLYIYIYMWNILESIIHKHHKTHPVALAYDPCENTSSCAHSSLVLNAAQDQRERETLAACSHNFRQQTRGEC